MADSFTSPADAEQIERDAYAWVQRRHDGLTAQDEQEFQAWLEADERHREAYAQFQAGWDRFEPLAAETAAREAQKVDEVLLSMAATTERPRAGWWHRSLVHPVLSYAAIAACLAMAWALWSVNRHPSAPLTIPALCEQRVLPDGSIIELNRNADVTVDYSGTERRIRLVRGEANFTVAKNHDRPFIVTAGSVQVRAVGTAFNVRLGPSAVNVVVTEGKVRFYAPKVAESTPGTAVSPPPSESGTIPFDMEQSTLLEVGQKATVPLAAASPAPSVVNLAPAQLEQELLWQPKILDFDNASLAEIVAEFNRRNPVHLVIDQDSTAERRMTANFRSDNMEGFVRLLESNFGIIAERVGDHEIRLKRK